MGAKQKIWQGVLRSSVTVFTMGMVVLVFLNAFLRYTVNSSIPQAEELSRYFFVWLSFLGATIAFMENQHIGVDLVTSRLKGTPKVIVGVLSDLVTLVALVIIFYGGIQFFKTSANSKGPATGIPFGAVSISIIISSLIMIITLLLKMVRGLRLK